MTFSLLVGSFCGAANMSIENSDKALMCSLSKINVKTTRGNCEVKRLANKSWQALSSGDCADQECSYACLVSDKLSIAGFASANFQSTQSTGVIVPNSTDYEMCVLTKATDDGSISSSCEIIRASVQGWKIISGTNACGYSCATFTSITPTTPAPPTTVATTTVASTTTAPTTPRTGSTSPGATTTPTTTPVGGTTTTTTMPGGSTTRTSTTAATPTTTSGSSGVSSGNETTVAVSQSTTLEPGVVQITQTTSTVSDKDSPTIAMGKVTLRIKDFNPTSPFGVTLRAPRKIGPETKLDLRMPMTGDLCALGDGQALFVVKGDTPPIEGDFSSVVLTKADGSQAPTVRQFEDGECDKVEIVSSRVNNELQFATKLSRVDCSSIGSAPVSQCVGERPLSSSDQKMATPEGDCEQVVSVLCVWHLIVIGVGACCCLMLCILLIVCLATRGGDDDSDDEEQGEKLEEVMWKRSLEGGSTINSTTQPFGGERGVSQVDNEQRTTQYDTDIAQQQQQQPQQTGIYASMPNDSQSQGDAFAYGDLVKTDQQQQQPEWGVDPQQDQQWAGEQQQMQQGEWDQQQQQWAQQQDPNQQWAGGAEGEQRDVASYVQQW
jgi:hypothetical protein